MSWKDMRIRLSVLWIFAVLNYIYADVFSFYKSDTISQVLKSSIDGIQITPMFLLIGAILMETAIIMVVVSRFVERRINRIANMIIGAIHTLAVTWSLTVGTPDLYYILFATIEIATTASIIWFAYNWKR